MTNRGVEGYLLIVVASYMNKGDVSTYTNHPYELNKNGTNLLATSI